MISKFSSTINNTVHCQPYRDLGRAIALFAFEGMYLFIGEKLTSVGIFGALVSWLNRDQLILSGRCKCLIAPT